MARAKPTVKKALLVALEPGSRLLLAVSGGSDSMSLLHACHNISRKLRLIIEVAHFDHGLRPDSQADARFVSSFCRNIDLLCHVERTSAKPNGCNVESWARQARYDYLTRVRVARGLDWIITAHTADDVAETLLMRLVANKDLRSILQIDRKRMCLRPLLGVSRAAVECYVQEHGVPYVTDETNSDRLRLRNRVRHELLPLLKQRFDPRIVEVLAQRAVTVAEDIDTLYTLQDAAHVRLSRFEFGSRHWLRALRAELALMQGALRWRMIDRVFRSRLGYNLGHRRSVGVLRVIEGDSIRQELPGNLVCRLTGGGLEVKSRATD